MSVTYKVEWPMSLGAPRDSLEAKQTRSMTGSTWRILRVTTRASS